MLHLKNESGLELHPQKKIIKAGEYAAYLQAHAIIDEAKKQAQDILNKAQEAFEAERKKGLELGMIEGKEKISEHMLDTISKTVKSLESFEEQVVDLVMRALKRIIGEMDDKELIKRVVQQAISMVRNQKRVTLKASPNDAKHLHEELDSILKKFPGVDYIDIIPDDRIVDGSCMLETDIGVVDARIDVQLEAIEKSLKKSIR